QGEHYRDGRAAPTEPAEEPPWPWSAQQQEAHRGSGQHRHQRRTTRVAEHARVDDRATAPDAKKRVVQHAVDEEKRGDRQAEYNHRRDCATRPQPASVDDTAGPVAAGSRVTES